MFPPKFQQFQPPSSCSNQQAYALHHISNQLFPLLSLLPITHPYKKKYKKKITSKKNHRLNNKLCSVRSGQLRCEWIATTTPMMGLWCHFLGRITFLFPTRYSSDEWSGNKNWQRPKVYSTVVVLLISTVIYDGWTCFIALLGRWPCTTSGACWVVPPPWDTTLVIWNAGGPFSVFLGNFSEMVPCTALPCNMLAIITCNDGTCLYTIPSRYPNAAASNTQKSRQPKY